MSIKSAYMYGSGNGTTLEDALGNNDLTLQRLPLTATTWSTTVIPKFHGDAPGGTFYSYNHDSTQSTNYWKKGSDFGSRIYNDFSVTMLVKPKDITMTVDEDAFEYHPFSTGDAVTTNCFQINWKKETAGVGPSDFKWEVECGTKYPIKTFSSIGIADILQVNRWQFIGVSMNRGTNSSVSRSLTDVELNTYWGYEWDPAQSGPYTPVLGQYTYTSVTSPSLLAVNLWAWDNIKIGTDRVALGTLFKDGNITLVRIWDRQLTDDEMFNVYKYNNINGASGAFGDPHILTFKNEFYDLDYNGSIRYFDNCNPDDHIMLNVSIDKGEYYTWQKKKYCRKVFLKHNNKYAIIYLGFRGQPVKVLMNLGFEYKEETLEFNPEAQRYCAMCKRFSSNDEDKIIKHQTKGTGHIVPPLIRNRISVIIKDKTDNVFKFSFTNVNEYNLQPCRINIDIKDKSNINNWKGAIVDRKHAQICKMEDRFYNMKPLPKPKDTDIIPRCITHPYLRDLKLV